MAELTVAVVDDNSALCNTVQRWLKTEQPAVRVSTFHSGEELLLSPAAFDIVYMDVLMDGASGIETARRMLQRSKETILIFISALREHVFDALDIHPFHYLLKPLDRDQFIRVFREACDLAASRRNASARRLVINSRKGSLSLPVTEIAYIERGPRRLIVHTKDNSHEMYESLNRLEGELGDSFYRCHRAFLVNLAWIRSYKADSIILQNGETIFLAKKKYSAFVKRYMWYISGMHNDA